MIVGVYRALAPRVTLDIGGNNGDESIEFVLDTAFEGELALPEEVIRRLGLPFTRQEVRRLADGSLLNCLVYKAVIDWHDDERATEVVALANRPILGTLLLEGSLVTMEATEGGEVTVEPL